MTEQSVSRVTKMLVVMSFRHTLPVASLGSLMLAPAWMKRHSEVVRHSASSHEKVRVEVGVINEGFAHEVATDVFRNSVDVESRAGLIKWKMDVVRIIMGRDTARDVMRETLARLDPEDQWAIIGPLAEELERRGIFRPWGRGDRRERDA